MGPFAWIAPAYPTLPTLRPVKAIGRATAANGSAVRDVMPAFTCSHGMGKLNCAIREIPSNGFSTSYASRTCRVIRSR